MKKFLMTALLLLFTSQIFAQTEIDDYENPVLIFQNFESLDNFFLDNMELNGEVFTALDVQKLKFKKSVNENGETNYYIDIPFYVNKPIPGYSDFGLVMINTLTWSVLDENKVPRVKSFRKIINGSTAIGIEQYNENLSTSITTPGKYYLKLITNTLPEESYFTYVFVGSIANRDGFIGDIYNTDTVDEAAGNSHVREVMREIAKCRTEIDKYAGKDKSFSKKCVSGDCSNGFGTYIWSNGEIYTGYWVNNKRNGVGINQFANGTIYEGEWQDDLRQGYGTNKKSNGEVEKGNWEKDVFKGE
ncbi:hypothetical protein [Robertkochia solimangrovi]|uniref:hypothetical protein n=1 Tax=Robertkochia solimangrovi TaxID=2213046 RepID=UPI00117F9AEB|nr:hypothetical protein [Robertkochia solimangrovi]TRZ45104.1 hypothetical protein DMZ48_04960 [Robertkochia solimangrovi]